MAEAESEGDSEESEVEWEDVEPLPSISNGKKINPHTLDISKRRLSTSFHVEFHERAKRG